MYTKMEKKLQKIFGKNCHMASVRFFESKKNQVALINCVNWPLAQYPSETSGSGRIALVKIGSRVKGQGSREGVPIEQTMRIAISKIIMKTFIWGERKKEEEILNKLHELGIAVPRVIKSGKNILFLEYIPGENLRTLYNKEKNPYTNTARKYDAMIAHWLGNFHKTFAKNGKVLLKGDMHLQNFIFQPISSPRGGEGRVRGRLYGVDFEESVYGAPEYDLAQLFAVFLTQIIKYPQKTMVAADFSLRKNKNDIVKHQKRVENFIKIYSKTSGINVNKNIDKLIKQELIKISKYLPHLKNNIRGLVLQKLRITNYE